MWNRSELKKRGLQTFNRNYWKCVLVALILALVTGGSSGYTGSSSGSSSALVGKRADDGSVSVSVDADGLMGEMSEDMDELSEDLDELGEDLDEISAQIDESDDGMINIDFDHITDKSLSSAGKAAAAAVLGITFAVIFLVIFAIVLVIDAFIFNPLELGCDRFFYKNLDDPAEVSEIAYGFDHGYKNVVKVLFARDIYTVLWSLLFIIPGIVKAYEYRMIPYLLAEDPDMDKEEAFARSKEMMMGQKWKTFVLDLSFIGWDILSLLTIGILGVFYVGPYKRATRAALYDTLKTDGLEAVDVVNEAAEDIVSGDF